jgi:S-adenosylmethionine:tRNA ribosyltransferase-isomerase
MTLTLSDFNYHLPEHLIAQHPPAERGQSRLLRVGKATSAKFSDKPNTDPSINLQDMLFSELPLLLHEGDLLVFNNTKVIKARLLGGKPSGGKVEIMIERIVDERHALAMLKASHAPKPGSTIFLSDTISIEVIARDGMMYTLKFVDKNNARRTTLDIIEQCGQLPLPPYITHTPTQEDEQRYQTVFAQHLGAVAAPTAGLHFTDELLNQIRAQGIQTAAITLHVGAGTFQPVKTENIAEHTMHSERFFIEEKTIKAIESTKAKGGRIIAVGTTSLRALESWAIGKLGDTDIFITPGFEFQVVDCLITNFHLPKSTLLMLVSAFSGLEAMRTAYQYAVEKSYRFFSYGDAMWLER